MLWIFVFVYVCLFVVMIQLLMAYQKRAYNLRVKQEPIRRRIRLHKEAMVETIDKLQSAVEARLDDLLQEVSPIPEADQNHGWFAGAVEGDHPRGRRTYAGRGIGTGRRRSVRRRG